MHNTTWTALAVYDGCPTTGSCVTATRSTSSSRGVFFEVMAGTEYYILIDTWAPPESPCTEGGQMNFNFTEGTPGNDCDQDFYQLGLNPLDYPKAYGFSDGFRVANDVVIQPNSSFAPHTLTFDVSTVDGEVVNVYFEVYEDDGSGQVGAPLEIEHTFTPGNYISTFLGYAYTDPNQIPVYRIELDLSDLNITFINDTEDVKYYWIALSTDLTTLNLFTYWQASLFNANSTSNPLSQYFPDDDEWRYTTTLSEGAMMVEGDCESLGINGLDFSKFSYYPNPTSNFLNIESNKNIGEINIYNLLGQVVRTEKNIENGQVDMTALPTGTYLLRTVFEDGSTETFKIIKN